MNNTHIPPVAFVLNKPIECNVICDRINRYMNTYFQNYTNDGNHILTISIKPITESNQNLDAIEHKSVLNLPAPSSSPTII